MRTRTPLLLHGSAIEGHPGMRAWSGLAAGRTLPVTIEVWRERKPTSIYRFLFEDGALPAVFAKHCDAESGNIQRHCYESLLPRLPLASPHYYGSFRDPDGTWWLFLEDVGRETYSAQDLEQRVLAGRWLGALHRHGVRLAVADTLPRAGVERHRAHLRSGRDHIRANLGNRAMIDSDRETLRAVLTLLDRVESRWDALDRALESVPETLVHGDFQPKNVRIHRAGSAPALHAFDWELAGWGLPAVDLAPANGDDLTIQVDPDAYLAEVSVEWPHLDAAAVMKQVALGHVLRRLAAIDWASHSLHFEHPDYLSDPVSSLQSIHDSLVRAFEAAEELLA